MKTVTTLKNVPQGSIISDGFEKIDYCDSYMINKVTTNSIDKITADVFNAPKWVNRLMKLRNRIVRIFGLTTDDDTRQKVDYHPIGSKTYFLVIARSDNEIILEEEDKHLNFRVSVLNDKTASRIYVTTIVHFNNFWGRLYFLPVKPFHKIILRTLLANLLKSNN